jgi:Cu+-exporting ATPase
MSGWRWAAAPTSRSPALVSRCYGGDLSAIVRARVLSQQTLRNIRQNLGLAFVYNLAAVPLAAGVLYPLTQTLLSPMVASLAMSLSSISVIANALRLRSLRL